MLRIISIIALLFCMYGCSSEMKNTTSISPAITTESNTQTDIFNTTQDTYYSLSDFNTIAIGSSTVKDVLDITSRKQLIISTSFGGYSIFPMKDGRNIVVEFYGPDLIVGDIKIVEKTGDGSLS